MNYFLISVSFIRLKPHGKELLQRLNQLAKNAEFKVWKPQVMGTGNPLQQEGILPDVEDSPANIQMQTIEVLRWISKVIPAIPGRDVWLVGGALGTAQVDFNRKALIEVHCGEKFGILKAVSYHSALLCLGDAKTVLFNMRGQVIWQADKKCIAK